MASDNPQADAEASFLQSLEALERFAGPERGKIDELVRDPNTTGESLLRVVPPSALVLAYGLSSPSARADLQRVLPSSVHDRMRRVAQLVSSELRPLLEHPS